MMTFSHELIFIGVVVFVCISFSIFCGLMWLLRCRRIRQRLKEDQTDRQMDVESFKDNPPNKALSKRAVSDTVIQPKRAETRQLGSNTEKPKGPTNSPEERIERKDLELRQIQPCLPKQVERIKNESTATRNKHHDTVSMSSIGVLERNDSKVNIFPADRMEDIDYNPGLNNIINLETI